MDFTQLWVEQRDFIHQIRSNLLSKLKDSKSELQLGQAELAHIAELLSDDALLLRFSNKAKFSDTSQVEGQLLAHIDWRLEEDLPRRDVKTLSETAHEYFEKGLLRFYEQDIAGRPLVILDMRHYSKRHPSNVEDVRSYLIFFMEIVRRHLLYLNQQNSIACVGQIAVLLDLQFVQVSSLSFDMLPTLYDLFHHHFPQTIGVVYVLNYGWIHAGVWGILKAALPESATRKMVFLSKNQITDYIRLQDMPQEYGGLNDREWSALECPIFHQFAFIKVDSYQHGDQNRVYLDLCGTGRRSPVKFSIHQMDSDRDSDLDEWYDADDHFPQQASSPPWASLYHEVSIDDEEDVEGIRPSKSIMNLQVDSDKVRPVKSASDLQQLLRVPSNRELSGLQPLPRAPSSKTLSSLMMTPIQPKSSFTSSLSTSSKTLSGSDPNNTDKKRRRKLSHVAAKPSVAKKPKRWSLTRWIVRMTTYLFGMPTKRVKMKVKEEPPRHPPGSPLAKYGIFSCFSTNDSREYGLSGGAVSLFFLVAVSFSWFWWKKRGPVPSLLWKVKDTH